MGLKATASTESLHHCSVCHSLRLCASSACATNPAAHFALLCARHAGPRFPHSNGPDGPCSQAFVGTPAPRPRPWRIWPSNSRRRASLCALTTRHLESSMRGQHAPTSWPATQSWPPPDGAHGDVETAPSSQTQTPSSSRKTNLRTAGK